MKAPMSSAGGFGGGGSSSTSKFLDNGNVSGATTIDLSKADIQQLTLTGNTTLTFANPGSAGTWELDIYQGGTGSNLISWPTTPALRWSGGSLPTLTTTPGNFDRIFLTWNGTRYLASILPNYSDGDNYPSSISGLVAWYEATDSSTITQSGGTVSRWADKSGNGYHLIQNTSANRPSYAATGINGHPAITFASANSTVLASSQNIPLTGDPSYTIVIVWSQGTSNSSPVVEWGTPPTSNSMAALFAQGTSNSTPYYASHYGNNSSSTFTGISPIITSVVEAPSGSVTVYQNGVNLSFSAASAAAIAAGPLQVGGVSGQFYFNGSVAGLAIYSQALSASDRLKVENYFNNLYGIY